jgi:fluoride exporter
VRIYFMVFLGSGIGGFLRYWGAELVYKLFPSDFPYDTLFVNMIGSFLIGLFMYYFDANKLISIEMRIFLTAGICGGLTTFSTFSYETMSFLKEREFLFAGLNILANIIVTLAALFIAYKLSKLLTGV